MKEIQKIQENGEVAFLVRPKLLKKKMEKVQNKHVELKQESFDKLMKAMSKGDAIMDKSEVRCSDIHYTNGFNVGQTILRRKFNPFTGRYFYA